VAPPPRPAEDGPSQIKVAGQVAAAQIVSQVPPLYPELARKAAVEGTVVLQMLIGKDGKVERLDLVSGPQLLVQSAMDAVRQWKYKPTLLNGEPVMVDSTVSVVFKLARQPASNLAPVSGAAPQSSVAPISVPSPPNLNLNATDSGPSLEETMKFIQDKLTDQAKMNYVAYLTDNMTNETETHQIAVEFTKVVASPGTCRINYHWKYAQDGNGVQQDTDPWFDLKVVENIVVMSVEQSQKQLAAAAATLNTAIESIRQFLRSRFQTPNHGVNDFLFYDEDLANRVAKAMCMRWSCVARRANRNLSELKAEPKSYSRYMAPHE